MPEILAVQWKPSGRHIIQFGPDNGQLQLLLDEYPKYTYRQSGQYFYALDGDFINVYEHKPGTRDAFGGREIVLDMVDGTQKRFVGSLWYPHEIKSADVPRFCSVDITTEPGVMGRGHTFYASHIRLGRYVELRAQTGAPVSFNDLN